MNTHETAQQTACQERSNFTKLAVAAIDFGTTYSGLAYSFHGDYQREPLKVNITVQLFRILLNGGYVEVNRYMYSFTGSNSAIFILASLLNRDQRVTEKINSSKEHIFHLRGNPFFNEPPRQGKLTGTHENCSTL